MVRNARGRVSDERLHLHGSAIGWSHLSSAIGFLLCIVGGVIAWMALPKSAVDDDKAGPRSRDAFMAHAGIALAILFALLTIAQWLPVVYGVPCSR